ncbi:MAG: Mur ligase family protein [Flavobacteriaceae bacterium]|nr:Mur ligase family protein [Flavobacteriaceae bacterium]
MKRVHFIAIGGSVMHNLAIALFKKKYQVTGSDDLISEPSKSRLKKYGLLPKRIGWFRENITKEIDFIILGMHAKFDNPELIEAQEKEIAIFSYPEFLYEHSKYKTRVVIAGSHGKTTITSMILHVLNYNNISVDYLVGAQLDGFETMVHLSENNDFILIEGDEYLSSVIDNKSKFLWYKPNIALISGIFWDHINVFPTLEKYKNQFRIFIENIVPGGVLIYNDSDQYLEKIVKNSQNTIRKEKYKSLDYFIENKKTYLKTNFGNLPLNIFGKHNIENLSGAKWICQLMGVDSDDFFEAILNFKGASKRLECLYKYNNSYLYKDFAHSPSKVKASCHAISQQFPDLKKTFCLELHTFSSLNPIFIQEYSGSLNLGDEFIVFYDSKSSKINERDLFSVDYIKKSFDNNRIRVYNKKNDLEEFLLNKNWDETVLLMMSSGNFGSLDLDQLINSFKISSK